MTRTPKELYPTLPTMQLDNSCLSHIQHILGFQKRTRSTSFPGECMPWYMSVSIRWPECAVHSCLTLCETGFISQKDNDSKSLTFTQLLNIQCGYFISQKKLWDWKISHFVWRYHIAYSVSEIYTMLHWIIDSITLNGNMSYESFYTQNQTYL